MALDISQAGRIAHLFDELQARKSVLVNFTDIYSEICKYIDTLEETLDQKTQELDSHIAEFDAQKNKTLESLNQREGSIPELESSALYQLEEKRKSALSELSDVDAKRVTFFEILRYYSITMNAVGLTMFLACRRKDAGRFREETILALNEAVDGHSLALDVVTEFLNIRLGKGLANRRWACGIVVQTLFPASELVQQRRQVSTAMVVRAHGLLHGWREIMNLKGEEIEFGGEGRGEASLFVHTVSSFGMKHEFDEEFLKMLVLEYSPRKDMAMIAVSLGFGDKMQDFIEELVKSGNEVEAVYFALYSGLTEKFNPISLLKQFIINSKKSVNSILKDGSSGSALEEANEIELRSCKSVIECVEDEKLEGEFPVENLRRRVQNLEEMKGGDKSGGKGRARKRNRRDHSRRFSSSHALDFFDDTVGNGSSFAPPDFPPPIPIPPLHPPTTTTTTTGQAAPPAAVSATPLPSLPSSATYLPQLYQQPPW